MKRTVLELSRYVIFAASLVVLTSCCKQGSDWTGGCFTVDNNPQPPGPHAKNLDKFCVEKEGVNWFFRPKAGMGYWEAIAGGTKIPMDLKHKDKNKIIWKIDADITNHPVGGDHGRKHEGDWTFTLRVEKYAKPAETKATLRNDGGDDVHGGSAHAGLD